jgi:ribose 5-phosphate isomerase B
LVCGSANGVAITANKHQGIRAAICWTEELAELSRKHNNANVLCIPARFVSTDLAKAITEKFLSTEFEGGRHANRVNKISC